MVPDDPDVWAELRSWWFRAMTPRPVGWRGWYDRSATVLEGGLLAWCGDPKRAETEGVMIDLPGKACASLGEDLIAFFAWSLQRGRVVRADYAIDDLGGRLTRDRILRAEAEGGIVSRWHGVREVCDRDRGKVKGWTLYFGSRQSECMVRIYDKALERAAKGSPAEVGSWVRLELESKGKFADKLAREYQSKGSEAVTGQINRRIRFVLPVEKRAYRCPSAPWWVEFMGSVEPGPSLVSGVRPTPTIETMRAWADRQVGPTLATVVSADGGSLEWLEGMLNRGETRMKSKHYAALAAVAD